MPGDIEVRYQKCVQWSSLWHYIEAVKNHLPHLHNYVELYHAKPSVSAMIIMSEWGAQQGDPLGSLLFCLAIPPIVGKLLSEFNVCYIDDGTIGCFMSDISHVIRIIKAEREMIGQTLNESKCELITSDHEVVLAVRNILPSSATIGHPCWSAWRHRSRLTCWRWRHHRYHATLQVERVLAPGRTFEKSQHTRRLLCSEKLF